MAVHSWTTPLSQQTPPALHHLLFLPCGGPLAAVSPSLGRGFPHDWPACRRHAQAGSASLCKALLPARTLLPPSKTRQPLLAPPPDDSAARARSWGLCAAAPVCRRPLRLCMLWPLKIGELNPPAGGGEGGSGRVPAGPRSSDSHPPIPRLYAWCTSALSFPPFYLLVAVPALPARPTVGGPCRRWSKIWLASSLGSVPHPVQWRAHARRAPPPSQHSFEARHLTPQVCHKPCARRS